MTNEDNLLSNLYGRTFHEDVLFEDIGRVMAAESAQQITENENVALMRDLFYRLSHDESKSPEVRADWDGLARAYENQLGVL